ncbi:hypothetical protein GOP47_0019693 [Adiantum capillus-veneris]|uniref:Homeobox domain-containing protein n=1 Tax=Adiantum capillus-veneris TaxID=13818 RepID=A0A9D4UCI4_ADICA|nr:hypothetical protein GOP47_0019693 [Adiantum capillus-veneris]
MDAFSHQAPNTALGLSLSLPTSPSKDSSPLSTKSRTATLNHNFNHPAGPLLNFLNPSIPIAKNPSSTPTAFRNQFDLDIVSSRPSPLVQLELLPLRPSPQKISLSPPSSTQLLHWQLPVVQPANAFSSNCMRAIDVNQLPGVMYADRDEISESSGLPIMKRERERSSDAEQERTCEVSSRGSDEEGEGGSARKKLRLSKEQSTLLEESFKEHSTLNPKQKAELAKQLNLRPRQVEVWFQNRRARTKLKQTEVDCELLKRCCESLTEENRRLQKEVQELRAIKVAPPCVISPDRFMPLPAATLSVCPSCERVASHATPPLPPASASKPSSALSFSLSPMPLRHVHPHHIPLSFPPPPPSPAQHALPSAAC